MSMNRRMAVTPMVTMVMITMVMMMMLVSTTLAFDASQYPNEVQLSPDYIVYSPSPCPPCHPPVLDF